jgi:hypothetical protein
MRTLVIIASLVLAFTQVALAASRQEHMAKTLAGCKNFMRDPKRTPTPIMKEYARGPLLG